MRIQLMLAAALAVLAGCSPDPGTPRNDCGGETVDLQTNVDHCGACETVCPTQDHAERVCAAGQCGRTPCESGYVDLDPLAPGCESQADSSTLPETGVVFWAFTTAGAYGDTALTSTSYRIDATLGESTPVAANGGVEIGSANYVNLSGFNAILH